MGRALVKLVVGIVIIGSSLSYLVWNVMQSSYAYYISVDDFAGKESLAQTHTLRIAGVVAEGSVARDLEKMALAFELAGKEVSLPVSYGGVVPDNFAEGREVVIEGRLDTRGVFQADKLMTKCESKYQAKVTTEPSDQDRERKP